MAQAPSKRASADHLPCLLLVDDSEAVLALEKAALGSTYRLDTAMNGRLALAAMQRAVPDAVLLDLSMPEMDGDQVLLAMRADPRLRDVPVLVVSTESQRARDTLKLGADDFLAKPATAEVLRRRVGALLEAAAPPAPGPAPASLPLFPLRRPGPGAGAGPGLPDHRPAGPAAPAGRPAARPRLF